MAHSGFSSRGHPVRFCFCEGRFIAARGDFAGTRCGNNDHRRQWHGGLLYSFGYLWLIYNYSAQPCKHTTNKQLTNISNGAASGGNWVIVGCVRTRTCGKCGFTVGEWPTRDFRTGHAASRSRHSGLTVPVFSCPSAPVGGLPPKVSHSAILDVVQFAHNPSNIMRLCSRDTILHYASRVRISVVVQRRERTLTWERSNLTQHSKLTLGSS